MKNLIGKLTIYVGFIGVPYGLPAQDNLGEPMILAATEDSIKGVAGSADGIPEPKNAKKKPDLDKLLPGHRVWTDISGMHSTQAIYLTLKDGKVHLEKSDKSIVKIPIGKLSKEDQAFVRQLRAETIVTRKKTRTTHSKSTRRRSSKYSVSNRIKRKVGNNIRNSIQSSFRSFFGR